MQNPAIIDESLAVNAIDVVFALLMVGSLFMMFRAKRRSEEKA